MKALLLLLAALMVATWAVPKSRFVKDINVDKVEEVSIVFMLSIHSIDFI